MTKLDLNAPRNHSVKGSIGVLHYHRYYKRNYKNPLKLSLYRKVLRSINSKVANKISDDCYDFKMPKRMGIIKIRKFEKKIAIDENGKVRHKFAPNWKATRELWNNNKEAELAKKIIFYENEHSNGYTYRIIYDKYSSNYKNKSLYRFQPNRGLTRRLSKNIQENNLEVFLKF